VQDRSILINDVDYSGKNKIVIGANPGKLFLLSNNGTWFASQIFTQSFDKNMKGLDFQDAYSNGKKEIVLATGIPYGLIYTLQWNGKEFQPNLIGNISQIFSQYNVIKNLGYNSLDIKANDIDNNGKTEIIVAGEADTSLGSNAFAQNNIFGWEATPYGFLVIYKYDGKSWSSQVLDSYSVLGLDIGELPN
jgi:hypothetical protein